MNIPHRKQTVPSFTVVGANYYGKKDLHNTVQFNQGLKD